MGSPDDTTTRSLLPSDAQHLREALVSLRDAMTGKISAGTEQHSTTLTPSTSPVAEKSSPERSV